MTDFIRELRFALRTFSKSPTFTAVVVLTLALGIGANAAIFGLMDQLLVRSLPVPEPERLVVLDAPGPFSGSSHNNSDVFTPISHPMFEGLRDRTSAFAAVFAHYRTSVHVTADGETEQARGDLVSGNFFPGLGVRPAIGRLFGPEDDRTPGAHPVVVLSHGYWRRRFAEAPGVLGRVLSINGEPMTVVGVTEAGFHGVEVGEAVDVYVPLMMQERIIPIWDHVLGNFRVRWLSTMARLAPGISLDEARAEANVTYRQLLQEDLATIVTSSDSFRERFSNKELTLVPGGRGTSELRFQTQTPLLVLMGMVAFVLLIACANVANLLLARSQSRQKEMALRVAIGASRPRLVRQLLIESSLLALAGGAVGILVASWTGYLLLNALPFTGISDVFGSEPDLRITLFAFALSLATGIAFGIVPSLQATAPDVAPTLRSETTSPHRAASRFKRALVVVQVALSLLLLVGAGLFVRSSRNLHAIDPGFETDRLVGFAVDPSLNGYDLAKRRTVLREIRDEVAAQPGVRSVSLAEVSLLTNATWSSTVAVEGYEPEEGEDMNPNTNGVAPEFFATLGMSLLAGREFTESDVAEAPRVVIVNDTFARYYFADASPLGRRLGFGRRTELDMTIVGVVKDGKSATLREEPRRFVYVPYMQTQDLGAVTFYVRAAPSTEALAPSLRRAVAQVDPALPMTDLKTMTDQIEESLFVERLVAALSVTFGVLATLLAALGLYGLLSYAVATRTREIGIRVALGAQRGGVVLLVLKEVFLLVATGILVGLPSGYLLGRIVESQLYGLSGADPVAIGVATAVLLAASLVAGYLPAMRATEVDPIVALRYE